MSEDQKMAADLNVKKAGIISKIMELRAEQARVKEEIAKVAARSGNLSIIANQVRCW